MQKQICGIYKITNKINEKIYVGQSVDIIDRWRRHKIAKDDYVIHQAIRKYGVENFIFEIIEECSREELDDKEKYWIIQCESFSKNGYNMTPGGQGGAFPFNEKEVKQYSLTGEYIATFKSLKQAGRTLGIDPRYISNCCLQKTHTAKGYQWCFTGNEHLISIKPKMNPGYVKIPVNQYDLQGKYLRTYDSMRAAALAVGSLTAMKQISLCCRGEQGSSKGYQWRFAEDNDNANILPYTRKLDEHGHNREPTVEVAVEQYSLEGKYITTYKNARIAADAIGLSKGGNSAILRACQGKQKTSGGFKWRYADKTRYNLNSTKGNQ